MIAAGWFALACRSVCLDDLIPLYHSSRNLCGADPMPEGDSLERMSIRSNHRYRSLAAAFALMLTASGLANAQSGKRATQPVDLTQPLSLDRAIRVGLANQPLLQIAKQQAESSKARVTQAMADYYPQISPQIRYSNDRNTFRAGGVLSTSTSEQTTTTINARQILYDSGKREASVASSKTGLRASEYNIGDTRQDIVLSVTTSYYELLRRIELVRVAESSVERAKTTLDSTKAFAEAGTAPKKDIFQAEADYNNAQVQVIQARNDVRLAQTSLKNAMGLLTPVAVVLPDVKVDAPSPEADTRGTSHYVNVAMEKRLDLKRALAVSDQGKYSVKIANINAGVLVEADIVEGYRFDPDPGENRSFVTTFSYPLFDAGFRRAQVRDAKASLEQSKQQEELTKQQIQLEVEQAYLLREESRIRLVASQLALTAAKVNYTAATDAQKEGAGTVIDIITAQTQLVTAETNVVQSIYDFYTSDARLKRAIGDNDTYLSGGQRP